MIETVRVSSRGQLVIPESIRKELNIKEGTKLVIIERQRKLILELEADFLEEIRKMGLEKEEGGWLALAEKGLSDIWDNPKDEETWSKYL